MTCKRARRKMARAESRWRDALSQFEIDVAGCAEVALRGREIRDPSDQDAGTVSPPTGMTVGNQWGEADAVLVSKSRCFVDHPHESLRLCVVVVHGTGIWDAGRRQEVTA